MESEYITETFLVELMIRILYNSSKNKWLMEISKDSFSKPETGKLRSRLSSTFFPVTTESLMEHQIAHCLTQLLQQHLSSFHTRNTGKTSTTDTVRSFCPVFSPVTHRSGVLYMLRSFSDPKLLSSLLKEAIELLDSLDSDIEGIGFTEFGVVKRIGDSSLFHSFPNEKDLLKAKELSEEMKHRFRLVETGTLFDEVIGDIDRALKKLSEKRQSREKSETKDKPEFDTKSIKDDGEKGFLVDLKRKRDRLKKRRSILIEEYNALKDDIERLDLEIDSVEKKIADIEIE
ncbi:unnamed protein product [Mytilus edulis]|uniref:Uncharacterized protein n=1 Tax=Mytilus edulis TaxID=6550 RepID=A0A8S3TUD1_MYTED|nr:unnamed protein product [Mytilus edulis]